MKCDRSAPFSLGRCERISVPSWSPRCPLHQLRLRTSASFSPAQNASTIDASRVAAPAANFPHAASTALNGFLGGGQVGYNVQMGAWLVGAEIQGSAANIRGTGNCGVEGANCTTKIDGLVTFAGRVGAIVMDRGLIYVKAGGAWAHDKLEANFAGLSDLGSESGSRWGWMFGTGIEHLIMQKWSAKLEYNFVDLGTKDRTLAIVSSPFSVTERLHLEPISKLRTVIDHL